MGSKKQVKVGNVLVGGGADVSIQSMLNVPSTDIEGSVKQAVELEKAGCQIIRAAIPNKDAVKLIPALKQALTIPVVADIHFDYKLALEACAAGVDKIRINPGNIGSDDRVKAVADACRQRNIPIRIGVNSGSLEKEILVKYGHPTPQALCDSALYHASLLEKFDFNDIVLSMKSSTVPFMVKAYELANEQCDYPLHLGVTEAGTERMGIIKSAAGIGSLLLHGIGDIHFDYKLALEACAAGVEKIRINPGNIGSDDRVKAVADACRQRNIPIRIGVNSGSLEKEILVKYGHPTPQALCDSALYHASLLEKFDFNDIVLSMKSSTVPFMVKAYELANEQCDYPLHLGVTEAGTERMGIIKSAAGIGSLLLHGIGDTIRVSLTADPVKEIYAANDILKALGLKKSGVQFVSCPTCGRTRIDLVKIAGEVENRLKDCKKNIKVAVMGCVVNGPGEAREADIGIAGGDGCGLVFKKGEVIRKVPEEQLVDALMDEIDKL